MGKYLLNIPFKEKEDELSTFLDIKNHMGDEFPFMKVVESEKPGELYVDGRPVKVISSYSYLDLGHREDVIDAAC